MGSLVCPDADPKGDASAADVPVQCPLLAVEVDASRGWARLIGPADREYRLPLGALKRLGQARLPASLAGATDAVADRMAPGPNPGVLTSQSAFGLLFRNASGALDTIFPGDLPALQPAGGLIPDMEACLDSLEVSPAYGLLFPPFAPDMHCGGGPTKASQGKSRVNGFSLKALAKPRFPGARREISAPPPARAQAWIFLLTADRHFIWRAAGGKARILEAPFMENAALETITAAEVDGDSLPELILEVKTDEGDGFHSTLYILRGGPGEADESGDGAPRIGSFVLEGSSAEADGSTVASAWWIRTPYIFHAYAQAANPEGRGISHDTRMDAYHFSGRGGFGRREPASSAAAFFGPSGTRRDAQAWCDSLSAMRPEALQAGVRPLPRLTPEGLSWQAGVIAPDLGTAKLWAGWDRSGKAVPL